MKEPGFSLASIISVEIIQIYSLGPSFGRFDRLSSEWVIFWPFWNTVLTLCALLGIWSRPHYLGAFAPFASFSPLIVPKYWNEYYFYDAFGLAWSVYDMSYLWSARARSLVVSAIGVGKFKMKDFYFIWRTVSFIWARVNSLNSLRNKIGITNIRNPREAVFTSPNRPRNLLWKSKTHSYTKLLKYKS